MSGFGGFCPLPLRLGGGPQDGWTASQHARLCADMVAVSAASSFAVITMSLVGGAITLVDYQSAHGGGLANAPAMVPSGTGVAILTWPATHEDDYGTIDVTAIRSARATAHGTAGAQMMVGVAEVQQPYRVEVRIFDGVGALSDGKVTVRVTGGSRNSRIGHYDGATDKTDARRETVPYAWAWYNEIEGALGSGFTTARTGLVHCRKLALARMSAACERGAEKLNTNSHPDTCDDTLAEWLDIMNVRLSGNETRQELRQLCAAKFVATTGNDAASVEAVCQRILGSGFVGVVRSYGASLAVPPANTWWPGINPGLPLFDLGGGTWFSERSQIVVQINRPTDTTEEIFNKKLNDLYLELDRLLPAWVTFTASILDEGGFRLDLDPMDGKGMT